MDPDATAARLVAAAAERALARRPVPASTYRLQMRAEFNFRDAANVVPYLHALGVTHLYLSPVLTARKGSHHGYDVVDPTSLNPDLGTEDDFRALTAAVRERGMGLILDTVPNHMAVGAENRWWRHVLEHGPSSPFSNYFDIAWDDPPRPDHRGRVTLPVLGSPYFQAIEAGEIAVDFEAGAFVARVYGNPLPVDPRTFDRVLRPALDKLTADLGPDADSAVELRSILNAVKHLPTRTEADPDRVREGLAEADVVKRRLAALAAVPAAATALEAAVGGFKFDPADPAPATALDELLDAQAYRLCFWRVASDEINYRRFFDVNDLAAVAAERDEVFRDTHGLTLKLLAEELADGLRIDHIDGLFAPTAYLVRLQWEYLVAVARRLAEADPEIGPAGWPALEPLVRAKLTAADNPASQNPLYVVVEKILGRAERLPPGWAADGTTGYEVIAAVYGVLVDPAGETPLSHTYQSFAGRAVPFPDLVYRRKMAVLASSFASELGMLTQQLDRLARKNRRARDFTVNGLRRAVRAVIASFPVYRVYPEDGITPTEEAIVRVAVVRARRRSPDLSPDLFDFVRDTLLLRPPPAGAAAPDYAEDQVRFAGKFQQLTSPVTAKGIEDTAFYVYNRMAALNEVGGDPGRFGWTPAEAHQFFADRKSSTPLALSPGATHDTKRGEDVRARLAVLAGRPDEWGRRATSWAEMNRRFKAELGDGVVAPDANDEYLLYQTLVGAWPSYAGDPDGLRAFADRVAAYMGKALREAKEHTSWINPNPEYEAAVTEFVGKVLDPVASAEFLADLGDFAASVARAGAVNGLAQTVVRCLAPGVPDTYQGTEFWDLSLVDPDNRRPVDYGLREQTLAELDAGAGSVEFARGLLDQWANGALKLFVVSRLLRHRRANPTLYHRGDYLAVEVVGPLADHVFAFARRSDAGAVLAVVPRFPAKLVDGADRWPTGDVWRDTRLVLPAVVAGRSLVNLITGKCINGGSDMMMAEVLAHFPVGALEARL